jgi:hypothetical protein
MCLTEVDSFRDQQKRSQPPGQRAVTPACPWAVHNSYPTSPQAVNSFTPKDGVLNSYLKRFFEDAFDHLRNVDNWPV